MQNTSQKIDDLKLSHLTDIDLDAPDLRLIANAINFFGSGQHPMADEENINGFDLDYMLNCLDQGIEATDDEKFKENVQDLWVGIHMAKEEYEAEYFKDQNRAAFSEGQVYKDRTDLEREDAFDCYKRACAAGRFNPSVSASVCFVAGYLGNDYPSNDKRVTS